MSATNSDFDATTKIRGGAPSSFIRLLTWIMKHGWSVQSSSHIHVTLTPSQTYSLLASATKPSVKRLGLRKLFANSRRYFIRATQDGSFQMSTSSRVWWHPKRRTPVTAILTADFEKIDETVSRLILRSRVKIRHLLGQFIYPTFFSSLVINVGWSPWIIAMCVIALYTLSWAGHRFSAMLEVHEITFFIETVLADYAPEPPKLLATGDADIVIDDDFGAEWDRFVEEKRGD